MFTAVVDHFMNLGMALVATLVNAALWLGVGAAVYHTARFIKGLAR